MTTKPHELKRVLDKGVAPVYLVSGDEPLLVQESCDEIRSALRKAGYEDRIVYHADQHIDWAEVGEELNAMSLFAERRRIEIHLPQGRLGDGRAVIEKALATPSDDVVVLLVSARLDKAETRRKWYKALQKTGIHVPIWPLDADRFPGWLRQRAQSRGLHLTQGGLEALAARLEGNLLAASQEVDRLALLAPDETLDDDFIEKTVMDNARFNVFELITEVLEGRARHAQRIIGVLEAEEDSILPLNSLLSRDLRMALNMQSARRSGQSLKDFIRENRIFPRQRAQQLEKAAQRLPGTTLHRALTLCSDIDRAAKGFDTTISPWQQMRSLASLLNQQNPRRA